MENHAVSKMPNSQESGAITTLTGIGGAIVIALFIFLFL